MKQVNARQFKENKEEINDICLAIILATSYRKNAGNWAKFNFHSHLTGHIMAELVVHEQKVEKMFKSASVARKAYVVIRVSALEELQSTACKN